MPSYSLTTSFSDSEDDRSASATVGDAADKRKVFDCVENSAEYTTYNTVALNTRSAKKLAKSATFPLESGLKRLAATKVAAPARCAEQGRSTQSSKRDVNTEESATNAKSSTKRDDSKQVDGSDEEAALATVFGNSVITPAKAAKAAEERFEPKTSSNEGAATANEADSSWLTTPPKSKGGTWLPDHILPSALDYIQARKSTPALKTFNGEHNSKMPNHNGDDGEDAPPEFEGLDSKSATCPPAEENVAENPSASHSFDANDEELEEPVSQSVNQVFLYKMKMLDRSYQWSGVHADVDGASYRYSGFCDPLAKSGPFNSHYDVHRKRIVLMLDNPGKTEDIIAMCLRNNEDIDVEELIRQFDYFSL